MQFCKRAEDTAKKEFFEIYHYGMIKEEYRWRDTARISYGIAAYANPEEDGTRVVLASLHDLSPSREEVKSWIDALKRAEISPECLPTAFEALVSFDGLPIANR